MVTDCFLYNECNHKDCDSDFCLRKYKLDFLYDAAQVSQSQRTKKTLYIDSDGTDREAFTALAAIEQDIVDFVAKGKNLYVYSGVCGNGKTSWSLRLLQAYFNRIWVRSGLSCRGLFINVPRFLLALKESISAPNAYASFIKDNLAIADIVIWDDIAAKVGTEYEINQLLGLLETRLAAGKANIFTSNLTPDQMQVALGARLASRVCQLSTGIQLEGTDKRSLETGGTKNA